MTKIRSEWLKLPASLYDVCAVLILPGEMRLLKELVSYTMAGNGWLKMV